MSDRLFQSRPVAMGRHAAVATPHLFASQAAIDVLQAGGNAVDAAVAAAAVCAVVQPSSSSVGGVGWATVYDYATRTTEVLQFHGTVPLGIDPDRFSADALGMLDWARLEASGGGLLGTLTPGVVPGWEELLRKRGSWPLARALERAIALATDGFPVSRYLHAMTTASAARLGRWPTSAKLFLPGGRPPEVGSLLRQTELGATLQRIAHNGAAEMRDGESGRALSAFYAEHGGALSDGDLTSYRPRWFAPLTTTYRGHTIRAATAPLGDVSFVSGLKLLERLGPFAGPQDPAYVHASVETAKLVREERVRYLGDDTDPAVVDWLLSVAHLDELSSRVGDRASVGHDIGRAQENTITLTVVDEEGNAVHLMQTVGTLFGTGASIPGAGFFSNSCGYFAYVGGDGANRIIPGQGLEQNPCINMVFDGDDNLTTIIGSPGGKTRVETVRQMLVNVLDFGMNLQQAVDCRRFLCSPDGVSVDFEAMYGSVDPVLKTALEERGHQIRVLEQNFGTGQAVAIDRESGARIGAADWRVEAVALAY